MKNDEQISQPAVRKVLSTFFGSRGLKINSCIKDETEVFHFLAFENVPRFRLKVQLSIGVWGIVGQFLTLNLPVSI